MISIDLAPVKDTLLSSQKNLSSLSDSLVSQATSGVLNNVPSISDISSSVSGLSSTIDKTLSSIGNVIIGESSTAIPKMTSMLSSLVPGTDAIKGFCNSALKEIGASKFPIPEAIKNNVLGIVSETNKLSDYSKSVTSEINSENQNTESSTQLLIQEIEGLSQVITTYSNDVGKYLFNPVTNTLPHFSELSDQIKTDKLLQTANDIKNSAVTISTGAVTSVLYKAAGILREASLRYRTKSMIYQNAEFELGNVINETTGETGKTINRIKGTSLEHEGGV